MQFSRKLVISYMIGLHLIIVFLVIKTDFIEKLKLRLGLPAPEISEHYREMIQYHSRIDQSVPENTVLLIGDSHIQSLYSQWVGFQTANFGIGNDTTAGVRKRLPGYRSLNTAKAVVLQIGVNDLELRSVEQTLQSYKGLLQELPPNTPILLNAVFPVSESVIADGGHWNKKISELNAGVQALCKTMENCQFLEVGDAFLDQQGNLAKDFHIGDGVHLSSRANEIWRAAIYRELKQFDY